MCQEDVISVAQLLKRAPCEQGLWSCRRNHGLNPTCGPLLHVAHLVSYHSSPDQHQIKPWLEQRISNISEKFPVRWLTVMIYICKTANQTDVTNVHVSL